MMNTQIFSGLKVLDFTWAAAGPIATKQFGDNGATVVKIESTRHPDSVRLGGPFKNDTPGINRSGFHADFNSSKMSIAVDMTHKQAARVVIPLVEWADIVAVSFRPGVMERWGFGYDRLREINPGIVMLNTSLYGISGPWNAVPGFGAQGQAVAGFTGQTGWPDRPPASPKGAYTDSVSARYAAAAIVAALIHRKRTGDGQFIEIAQVETGIEFLAPQLLQYQLTGIAQERNGNCDPTALLHGVFPTSGDDRWIAIEVWNQEEWKRLLAVLAAPAGLAPDELDASLSAAPREDLEQYIGDLTAPWDGTELMGRLRERGVACGVVMRPSDLCEDVYLRERDHFWSLPHPEMGTLDYNGPAYRFEKTPSRLTSAAPCLGEHTDHVLRDILSFGDDEVAEIRAMGLLV